VTVSPEPQPLAPAGREPMAVLNNAFGFGGHNVSVVFVAP
jgi:3-oxoacyl-(acyl-carrier-protein) synthase